MSEIENLFDEEYLVPNVKGAALQPGRDHRSPQLNEMLFSARTQGLGGFFVSPLNFHYFQISLLSYIVVYTLQSLLTESRYSDIMVAKEVHDVS